METIIKCPNCSIGIPHEYTKETYTPIWTTCEFCGTKIKWQKSKTIEIIPQDRKWFITIKKEHNNNE